MGAARHGRRLGAEFRALAVSECVSTVGDQLAKVGVATMVYQATGSASAAALALAGTFLPDLIAGPLLTPLADRFARRHVMVLCAVVQATLAALLAFLAAHALSVTAVIATVVGIAAASAPFKAAQMVTVTAALPAELRGRGQNRLMMVREVGQLAGLGAAAAVVSLIGPTTALLLNAVSFAFVAVLLWVRLRPRPAPRRVLDESSGHGAKRNGLGWRIVWTDPQLRALNLVVLVGTFTIVPEAVIIPLIKEMGAPTWTVGPLMAADVIGYLIGAQLVDAVPVLRQRSWVGPLFLISLAPLALFALHPGPVIAFVLLLASGFGASYLPIVRTLVLDRAPDHVAGRVGGWLRTGLRAGQGLGVVAGGVLADLLSSPALAVALAGMAGTVAALGCLVVWAHSTTSLRYEVAK